MKPPKILIFIPSYNCETQIVRTLNQLTSLSFPFQTVLVLDNKSTDGTVSSATKTLLKMNKNFNFLVARNFKNRGLGGSHKEAFSWALEQGFSHVVVFHGDDQANIREIENELSNAVKENLDTHILGSRFMPGSHLSGYSRFRIIGNYFFNALFTLATRKPIYDLGSGLNIFCLKQINKLNFWTFADDLTFNCDLLLALIGQKQPFKFVPISWREEDQKSNVRLLRQTLSTLSILIHFMLKIEKAKVQTNQTGFEILLDSEDK